MNSPLAGRPVLPFYFAVVITCYCSTAGISTVYSMLSMLYRVFDEPLKIGWVVTSYYLVASICAAICGRIGDVVGRRRMAITMLCIAGIGSLVSATSDGLNGVILGCALQGATGTLTPLSIGIVREALAREKVPFAIGIITATGTAGGGLSFMIAGFFIDHYSWQGGFYMKAVLVVIAVAALLAFAPPPARKPGSLAITGMLGGLLFVPAIAGIFITFQLAHGWSWHDVRVWGTLAASLVTLVFWGWHQSHQANPLIDVRSLGKKELLLANLCVAMLALGCMQNGQVMSLLLQQPGWTGAGFGMSAMAAGALLLPLNAIALIGSPWSGILTGRKGARYAALIGSTMIVASWITIALFHKSFLFVIAVDVVGLFGMSFVQPAAYNTVVAATASDRTSEAAGLTYVFLNTFLAIGGQIVFLLLATSTVRDTVRGSGSFPDDAGYTLVFGFIAATALVGLLFAWLLPHRRMNTEAGAAQ